MIKCIIFVTCLICFTNIKAQSIKIAVTNHIFILCDSEGIPVTSKEQSFFLNFHSNGKVTMLCGGDLNHAMENKKINKSTTMSGFWKSSDNNIWFKWSNRKTSEIWTWDFNTGSLYSEGFLMKDLGVY